MPGRPGTDHHHDHYGPPGASPADGRGGGAGGEVPLADLFWVVARRLRHLSREAHVEWDVTPAQSRALRVLVEHEGLRPSVLSERLRIAPRSATEVVDALVERGLAVRRPDPGDRRATLVEVTDRGREAVEAIHRARIVGSEAFFAVLSPQERADLVRILGRLQD